METLLPWQPDNCTITQLYEAFFDSYLEQVIFGIKHITVVAGTYGNAITMATKEVSNNSA